MFWFRDKYLFHKGYDFTREHVLRDFTKSKGWTLFYSFNCSSSFVIVSEICCYFQESGEEQKNEWSHLLLWPRQDSNSGVVMFNAPALLPYSLLILSSLSLSFRISEHKQQIDKPQSKMQVLSNFRKS